MKPNKDKTTSLDKVAHLYNGRSRDCAKCLFDLKYPYHYMGIKKEVLEDICKQCTNSFVEGFKKGYKHRQKQTTNKKLYNYINEAGDKIEVFCTRQQYLFLKLTYGKDGLTNKEYKEYKSYE